MIGLGVLLVMIHPQLLIDAVNHAFNILGPILVMFVILYAIRLMIKGK